MSDKNIREYFQSLFNKKNTNMGKIENADIIVEGKACEDNRDMLSLYGTLKDGRLMSLSYICKSCDPYMFVAADILCKLSIGKVRKEIDKLGKMMYEEALGGNSDIGYDHFVLARKLLSRKMRELEPHRN
ncbi:MAG: hypothetical protein IEMM0003_0475 [bacterium]|nr:MAG: hypothetical protein IEMM0003_0475 [bacterium]